MGRFDRSRRSVLGVSSAVLLAAIAGCATTPRSDDSDPTAGSTSGDGEEDRSTGETADDGESSSDSNEGETEGANEADDGGETEDADGDEDAATSSTDSSDGLSLPGVDVRDSPGGLVDVTPPDVVVVLDFFATWCPPCEPEMANLRAVRDRYDDEEVFVVSITQETDEAAIEEFWEDHEGTWPVVMDPDLRATRAYDATSIPTIVVLDRGGTETFRDTGLVGESTLVEAIDAALEA